MGRLLHLRPLRRPGQAGARQRRRPQLLTEAWGCPMRINLKQWTIGVIVIAALGLSGFASDRVIAAGGTEVTALFDATIGLYPGSDVQVLGVAIGTVTAVEPDGGKVRVSMKLDRGQRVAADTSAVIIAPTLVSDRFVQLTEPYVGGAMLESGDEITKTAVPVEIDELYASLNDVGEKLGPEGANRNGALSELLTVAAENLKGQGADINTMFGEFSEATSTLSSSDDDLFATIANLKEFNDMLVENDTSVAQVNRQFEAVTDFLAEDRQSMAGAIASLGDSLAVLDDFIRENRGNLKTSVDKLTGPSRVLVNQQESLDEAVRTIPLALQNFLNAYNIETNTVDGRGNLNELSLWSTNGLDAKSSADAPPVLLPGLGEDR
ncbi:MCE family protein [Mumia zhuanghuii]|uniref:MCE family protein n=2 Tax=Mumia zhuanghuii TaxID=2585211 RepID=A0A5C4N428_9ACTN|nr:MCE family protein [Mumia zhuanghuii]